ncbi:ABC transporter substrate-binding protein [Pigmentiphaga sp. NML080357]|nr:ABC transporter substrate-binding protein [Pigmentiphaga sp. NML080357]
MQMNDSRIAALVLACLGGIAAGTAQAQVKIGFMAELSGPQAMLGQDMYDGFMLAVEQEGGKLGGVPVTIVRRDSQLKPEVATQIADELIEREKVPLVAGLTFSNVAMAVTRKFAAAQVYVVSGNAGPSPTAGSACTPYFFSAAKQNDQFAEASGTYAKQQGYARVIALAPNYQAGKDFVAGFKRNYGQPLADEIYTPLAQLDFSAEITRIAAAKPDAVYAFYPGANGVAFVRAYGQAGLLGKIPLLTNAAADGTNLPALKEAALGVFNSSNWGPDLPNAENRQFVEAFEAKYQRIPSEYAAQSYDAARLIGSALKATGGKVDDKAALGKALRAADFKSVRGNFRFNTNNYPIQDFYMFVAAKDARGRVSLKTVSKPLPDAKDSFHAQCRMS